MFYLIGSILVSSIKKLFREQPDILLHTDDSTMTEWNLGHHLANEISKYIFWLNHDLDLSKRNYENRRPDIIFHKHGIHELNFLVIELKINGDIENDIEKLKNYWMSEPLRYRFGASINIKSAVDFNINLFSNEVNEKYSFSHQNDSISVPSLDLKDGFAEQVNRVTKIINYKNLHNSGNQKEVREYKKRTDQMVFDLYGFTNKKIRMV